MGEVSQSCNRLSSETAMETNQGPDLTMQPAIRKTLKPEVQRKLIKRAVMYIVPENPIGALHALFEKESFRLEFIDSHQVHKAVLRIDGRVFERVSTQKRKARDSVVIDALEYLFSDIVNDMRNRYSAAIEQQNIIMLSKVADSLTNTPPKTQIVSSKQKNDTCGKKVEPDLPNNVNRPPMKKELKPAVVERLVKQALGLVECDNPNTVTALFSLFEKEVFTFEVVQLNQNDVKFQANLQVGNQWYSDSAISIKKAKSKVTRKALRDLFPEFAGPGDHDSVNEEIKSDSSSNDSVIIDGNGVNNGNEISNDASGESKDLCFSDFVSNLIQSKYHEMIRDQPEHLRRYSVLSGIVMMQNNDTSTACVISLSTGDVPNI